MLLLSFILRISSNLLAAAISLLFRIRIPAFIIPRNNLLRKINRIIDGYTVAVAFFNLLLLSGIMSSSVVC